MARTSSMDNFIPEIWSARLLAHLDKAHVYASLLNRDYEGEIRAYGDTVHINQIGKITIRDYDGSDIEPPEELDGEKQTLVIDKAKYFNFQIKDIDAAQTNPKLMDAAMSQAAYDMNDEIDTVCANVLTEGVAKDNIITVSGALTPENAYDYLVDMGTVLSESNVSMMGRWVVIPPWFHGLLLKDKRFISFGQGVNANVLGNGKVGEVSGFTVHVSNNVPHTYTKAEGSFSSSKSYYTKVGGLWKKVKNPTSEALSTYFEMNSKNYQIVAGTNMAGTYAEQLVELEPYRREHNFSDAIKGLNVFGTKVLYPNALAVLTATRA